MVDVSTVGESISQYNEEEGKQERPPSEQLVELHIYLVPKEKWLEKRKLAKNQAVDHTISVGFVRVLPQTHLSELRKEMNRQLGIESVPQSFVFLRSVGRNFTQVRPRQEMEMKVKNFMPPYATEPEIYLKEGPYTGPNTWSQGEDSGLEESVGDSNSQKSHDRDVTHVKGVTTGEFNRAIPEFRSATDLIGDPLAQMHTEATEKQPPNLRAHSQSVGIENMRPATPESLADDQLLLSKVTDLIDSIVSPDIDDHRPPSTPTTEMAIPMEEDDDDILSAKTRQKFVNGIPDIHKDPMKPSEHRESGSRFYLRNRRRREHQDDLILDYNDPPRDVKETVSNVGAKARANSLNRRPNRLPSKERGGTQLPTWNETRTTRLRRSKALGENKPENGKHLPRRTTKPNGNTSGNHINAGVKPKDASKERKPAKKAESGGEEDDNDNDNGKVIMERIRANSRCLRARLSSHNRRYVAGTGAGARDGDLAKLDARYKSEYNGVYTMHSRRNMRGAYGNTEAETVQDKGMGVENTSVKLVDSEGNDCELDKEIDVKKESLDKADDSNPEVLHLHTLSLEGEDGRAIDSEEIHTEGRYEETAENENFAGNESEETAAEEQKDSAAEEQEQEIEEDPENRNEGKEHEAPEAADDKEPDHETVSELEEGHVVNHQSNNLTIEVEVKEVKDGGEDDAAKTDGEEEMASSQPILIDIDDSVHYDSYPVYSEQNLPYTSSVEFPVPTSPVRESKPAKKSGKGGDSGRSRNQIRKQDKPQYSRGIYLRKKEHRDRSQSSMRRSQSDGSGLDSVPGPTLRTTSRTRRGGMGSIEKWNTTSSTGDLTELPWSHVSEKERLLSILDSVRAETRAREKHREELLRRIKQLQNRVHQRREQVREMWRKRYLEAKKVTPRLEEECSRLRQELEKLHRELLAKVQAGVWALLTISGKTEKPSNKLSYKIMIARLLQEIEDLSRRVEGTRLKLHTEVKLRAMAEKDVRNLREELLKKKIQVTLTRNQEQAAMGNGIRQQYFISAV